MPYAVSDATLLRATDFDLKQKQAATSSQLVYFVLWLSRYGATDMPMRSPVLRTVAPKR